MEISLDSVCTQEAKVEDNTLGQCTKCAQN